MSLKCKITLDILDKVEQDTDSIPAYDLNSLIFLLYGDPQNALKTITVFTRTEDRNSLLVDWARNAAQNNQHWQEKFLEALCICKLYGVVKKLGINVDEEKNKYLDEDPHYVDPMMIALYNLCENMTAEDLSRLKKSLSSYKIEAGDCINSEMVLLQLIQNNFITVKYSGQQRNDREYKVEALATILSNMPGLKSMADNLMQIQSLYNTVTTNEPTPHLDSDESQVNENNITTVDDIDFTHIEDMIRSINLNEVVKNLTADSRNLTEDMYPIKDPQRVGVCYIQNQEKFFPSACSIALNTGKISPDLPSKPLENRVGSTVDKIALTETMRRKNFKVITSDNLDHEKMLECIKWVIQHDVHPNDSMFVLCVLSHGSRGHVYASDSVKFKVEDIQNVVSEQLQLRKLLIPKIFILEACQNDEEQVETKLPSGKQYENIAELLQHDSGTLPMIVRPEITPHNHISLQSEASSSRSVTVEADGPITTMKAHCVTCYAACPSLQAFRYQINNVPQGSIFIRMLCENIDKHAPKKHILEIFTKVNNDVTKFMEAHNVDQVANCTHSLTKDLYLMYPN